MFETLHCKNMCHGGFVGKSDALKTGSNVKVVVSVTHRFLRASSSCWSGPCSWILESLARPGASLTRSKFCTRSARAWDVLHGPRDSRKRTASAHRVMRERRAWYPFAASQTRPSPRPLPAWFANRLQFCLPHREGTRLENLGAGTSRRSPYRVPGFADAALSPTEVSEGVSPQDHSRSGER